MKIKIRIDDEKTARIWAAVQRCAREIESWPSSKRGLDGPRPAASEKPHESNT